MPETLERPATTPVDLEQYHPLARLRRVIRAFVLAEGLLLALILVCVWFWFSTALDFCIHYFFGVDLLDEARSVRVVMIAVFAASVGGVVVWYIVRRLFHDFKPAALALVLEKRYPELLGDRLITAVELADLKRAAEQGYSVDMIKKTMLEAKQRVDTVDVLSVFNWRRLAVLAWMLVGVSAFILLLIYPVSMLFSLRGRSFDISTWRMLIVNSLLALAVALLFVLPCLSLSRQRSPRRGAPLLLTVLGAVVVAGGFYFAFQRINDVRLRDFSWRLYHVMDICRERNLSFQETRWPHDEYFIQWLDFPVAEKRIQANKTVGARVYFCKYIVADNAAPKGWRPLAWKDLRRVVDPKRIPALPLSRIHDYLTGLMIGDESAPVGYDKSTLILPDEREMPVDLALAAVADTSSPDAGFGDDERSAYADLASALDAHAADPRFGGRLVRRVEPPDDMWLHYGSEGSKQNGRSALIALDSRKNVYALQQPVQLGDNFSVKRSQNDDVVYVHAEAQIAGKTVQSPSKLVGLVRPPRVQLLVTQEFRPAYYYYLPPAAPRADTIDERRRLLRNLRQVMPERRTEYPAETFDVSNFTAGSELVLTATSDKKLQEATLTPRTADFPGCVSKDDLLTIPLKIGADGRTFTIRFVADGRPLRDWAVSSWLDMLPTPPSGARRDEWLAALPVSPHWAVSPQTNPYFPLISRLTTFEVSLRDEDNMVSQRSFTVHPLDDKLPGVNAYVDVIREVQTNERRVLMCTARALIPFTRESIVTDDNGLHKVEFTYEYTPLAGAAVLGAKAELAAWLWASSPIIPSLGDFVYRREVLLRNAPAIKSAAAIKGTAALTEFDNAQAREAPNQVLTLPQLEERLKKRLPEDYKSPLLARFELQDGDKPISFDLQSRLPRLAEKDVATGVQPSYELILNVRVTDSNVVADTDRVAENKDGPFIFRIVPEQQLQALIVREEAELVRRFEEMLTRLEGNQRILQQSVMRLPSLSPTTAISEQTRVEGIADIVSKSRDTAAEVQTAYARILREYEVNRFDPSLTKGLSGDIIEPLKSVLAKEFPKAEESLAELQRVIKEGQAPPALAQAGLTLQQFQELIVALNNIRSKMGESLQFKKIVGRIGEIINEETKIKEHDLEEARMKLLKEYFEIQIKTPEKVDVAAGKSAKVSLTIRMPVTITNDPPSLRFEVPAESGLEVKPREVKLEETSTSASIELIAGKSTGVFSIKIVPSQGTAVDLKVIVR